MSTMSFSLYRPFTRGGPSDRRPSGDGGNDFADPTVKTDDNDLVHHKVEAREVFEENLRNAGLHLEHEQKEVNLLHYYVRTPYAYNFGLKSMMPCF